MEEEMVNATQEGEKGQNGGIKPVHLTLLHLVTCDALKVRAAIDEKVVEQYAELMSDGVKFDPVIAYPGEGDTYDVVDGFHRLEAAKLAGRNTFLVDIREGGREDALWHALEANRKNGHRMQKADLRKAVGMALGAFPDKSQETIARHIGCSQGLVSKVKQEMEREGSLVLPEKRMGADGKVRPTSYSKAVEPQTDEGPDLDAMEPVDDDATEVEELPVPVDTTESDKVSVAAKPEALHTARKALKLLQGMDPEDPEYCQAVELVQGWVNNCAILQSNGEGDRATATTGDGCNTKCDDHPGQTTLPFDD